MPSIRRMLPICALAAASALAQISPSSTTPVFEVASVRPSKSGSSQHSNVPLDSGNVYSTISADDARTAARGYLVATHQPLWRYISFAYKLSGTQELAFRFNMFCGAPKSGAPFWVTGSFDSAPEFFDVSTRAPADPSIDAMRLMMQALLADRFHLVTRSVTADAPVFALVLARAGITGPKLQPHSSTDVCAGSFAPASTPSAAAVAIGDLPPLCNVIAHVPSSTPGQHYGGRAVPLSLLASSVPTMTGIAVMPRPVVDQTGLGGLYDFALTWVHDVTGEDAAVADNAANFRNAIKLQLGLELKPARAPIRFLLIDHVERPSEN